MDRDGVEVRPIASLLGPHHLNEVFLDDVRAGPDDVLGPAGEGWRVIKDALSYERVGIATIATVQWATERVLRRVLPGEAAVEWIDPSARVALVERLAPTGAVGTKVAALDVEGLTRVVAVRRLGVSQLPSASLVVQEGDVLYLAVYPCLMAGILILVAQRNPGRDRASLIDSLIIAIGAGVLSWVFLMAPYWHDAGSTLVEKLVSIAYQIPLGEPAAELVNGTERLHAVPIRILGNRFELTGPVADVAAFLAGVDVAVLPSHAEGMSNALLEYMAAGRPIVASALPSIREVLRDGENAILVEPGSGAAIADGLRRLMNDRALGDRLACRAFADVAAFGWDQRAARLESLLDEVVRAS